MLRSPLLRPSQLGLSVVRSPLVLESRYAETYTLKSPSIRIFTLLTHYFPILILCSCFVTIFIVKSAI